MPGVYSSASDCRGGGAVRVLAELRRRNVFRAATLYAAAAWLVVQVATQVLPLFGAPNWTLRMIVLAAVIGFPFVLAVSWYYELTPEGLKRESEVPREESIRHIIGKRLDRAIIAVLSVAVVLLLANTLVRHRDVASAPDKSVAVLPLLDEGSGAGGNRYFSDGLSEELISELTRIEGLKVIGRNSSFQFRDSKDDSRMIGAKLGVANLLEGSVRRVGEAVRISAELISVVDGSTVWSERYDRPYRDLFALQDDITAAVATALKARLLSGAGVVVQSDRPPSGNLEAYSAYLQGKFYDANNTESDDRKAIDYFNEAIRLDPRYVDAYAGLSHAWTSHAAQFLSGSEMKQAYEKAREASNKGLALDQNNASAHLARAFLLQSADFDWSAADAEFRRALQLAPEDGTAKFMWGVLLATLGKPESAVRLTQEALAADPLHAIWYNWLALYLSPLGRLDEAEAAIRKAIALHPNAVGQFELLAIIEVQRGDAQAALQAAQQEPPGVWQDTAVALAQQISGNPAAADAALKNLVDKQGNNGAYQIADVYALRNDADKLFEWLDIAWANSDPGISSLLYDPFFAPYKREPRFAVFCKKVGLPSPGGVTASTSQARAVDARVAGDGAVQAGASR
jgi:TolB-like protein/Tfp pilus assembly protein PilF